jgi:hypothetical protein
VDEDKGGWILILLIADIASGFTTALPQIFFYVPHPRVRLMDVPARRKILSRRVSGRQERGRA